MKESHASLSERRLVYVGQIKICLKLCMQCLMLLRGSKVVIKAILCRRFQCPLL